MKLRPEFRGAPALGKKKPARHSEAMILFGVGDVTLAIAANAVEEIRNADSLRPLVQQKVAKVRYLIERAGKTYYVVDAGCQFRMLPMPATRVLILRRGNVALLVQRIDLMKEVSAIYALPSAFHGEERQWYRGLAAIPGVGEAVDVIPVVNPDTLLSAEEIELLGSLPPAKGVSA
jgi:chemotaxis signal transduction protein